MKNMRRQKQVNELRENYNRHQSETKNSIKREIDELKKTTQNIKEELNKIWKNQTKNERECGTKYLLVIHQRTDNQNIQGTQKAKLPPN
jgi:hypothetical protein